MFLIDIVKTVLSLLVMFSKILRVSIVPEWKYTYLDCKRQESWQEV